MIGKKVYLLDPIKIKDRILYPIVSLKVILLDNLYLSLNYELLAFKIIENNLIYYVGNNLSDKELSKLEKLV